MKKYKFTDGCPNGCEYCYEPKVIPKFYEYCIIERKEYIILIAGRYP